MATIYKIDLEIVSERINYPKADVERIIKELIEGYCDNECNFRFRISNLEVTKK
jgi:hypothetical protein